MNFSFKSIFQSFICPNNNVVEYLFLLNARQIGHKFCVKASLHAFSTLFDKLVSQMCFHRVNKQLLPFLLKIRNLHAQKSFET